MTTPPLDVSDGMQVAGGDGAILLSRRSVWLVVRSLFLLTKPRIVELLLVTTLPTMFLADRGVPSLRLVAATVLLGTGANWLSAVLAGAAGCFPVLVGWAAVTGTVSWPAWALFAVIFCWTPPHFWALAMKFRDDYAAARVPMLPVVATPAAVARKIVIYSYLMVAVSLALTPAAGWAYGVCALMLGGWFLAGAHRLRAHAAVGTKIAPMRLFHTSIAYLTLLFAAVAVAALLPKAW